MNQNLNGVIGTGLVTGGCAVAPDKLLKLPPVLEKILVDNDGVDLSRVFKDSTDPYSQTIEKVNESFLNAGRIEKHNLHSLFEGNSTILKFMLRNKVVMEKIFDTEDMNGTEYVIPIHGDTYNEFFVTIRKEKNIILGEMYIVKMFNSTRDAQLGHFISYYNKNDQHQFIEVSETNVRYLCESLFEFNKRGIDCAAILETLAAIHIAGGYLLYDNSRPHVIIKDLFCDENENRHTFTIKYDEIYIPVVIEDGKYYINRVVHEFISNTSDMTYNVVVTQWDDNDDEGGLYNRMLNISYESALLSMNEVIENIIKHIKYSYNETDIVITDRRKGVRIEDKKNKLIYIVSMSK